MRRWGIGLGVLCLALVLSIPALAGSKSAAKRHYKAGVKQGRSGEIAQAIESFRQALVENPKMFKAALDLGLACSMSKRWPEAIAAYQTAVKVEPGSAKARKGLGEAFSKLGAHDSAVPHFERLVKLKPKEVGSHSLLGVSLAGIAQHKSAIASFKKGLGLRSDDFVSTLGLAGSLYAEGALTDAVKSYETATRFNAKSRKAWMGLGQTHQRLKNRIEAKSAYSKACDLGHKSACKKAMLL